MPGQQGADRNFESFSCACDKCFESSSVSFAKLLSDGSRVEVRSSKQDKHEVFFGEQCVDIDDCSASGGEGGYLACRAGGDTRASCADTGACSYTCSCSAGYECTDDDCTGCQEVVPLGDECGSNGVTINVHPPAGGREEPTGIFTCKCDECYQITTSAAGFQSCVDINECLEVGDAACGDHGTCQQGETGTCAWSCICDEGFDCGDVDCHSCEAINPCQGTPEGGQKDWFVGGAGEPASCGPHGQCIDSTTGSSASCECDQCFKFDIEQFICVEINECEEQGLNLCRLDGDVHASCSDTLCGYTCACSVGFVEVNGVCVDQNDCEPTNGCNGEDGAGACVDNAAPDTGYKCYCNCGYFYNQDDGSCDSCQVEFEFYDADPEQNKADGRISNDENNLYILIRSNQNSKNLVYVAVNLDAAGDTFRTERDSREYKLDGTPTKGDHSCGPKIKEFSVHERLVDLDVLSDQVGSDVGHYTFTIPLSQVQVSNNCSISVIVYAETYNADATAVGFVDRSFALPEGETHVTSFGAEQNCQNSGFFSVLTFTVCGHPKCAHQSDPVLT